MGKQMLERVSSSDAQFFNAPYENHSLQSWLGVPLKSQSGVLVLKSFSANYHYNKKDTDLLRHADTEMYRQ